jgi:hypothetical protein
VLPDRQYERNQVAGHDEWYDYVKILEVGVHPIKFRKFEDYVVLNRKKLTLKKL